jgi:hypothetical protein
MGQSSKQFLELFEDEILQQQRHEHLQEQEYEPHYITYQEKLKNTIIENLEKISGVSYKQPYFHHEPSSDDWIAGYWVDETETISQFVVNIVAAGKKREVADYINFEIEEITYKIRDNRYSEGRIADLPAGDNDSFWEEKYTSEADRKKLEAIHSLEVERIHRAWLVAFKRQLFTVSAVSVKQGKVGKSDVGEWSLEKLLITKDSARKLDKILLTKGIVELKPSGLFWLNDKSEIGILGAVLREKKLVRSQDKTNVGRVLAKRYNVRLTPQLEESFRKPKKGKGEWDEFESIVAGL